MRTSLSHLRKSIVCAGRGIKFALSTQPNFFLMILIALVTVVAGLLIRLSLKEWVVVTFLIGLVLVLEILNTAIEQLLDFLEPRFSLSVGRVKDLLAGVVLIAAIVAAFLGLLIFVPKLLP